MAPAYGPEVSIPPLQCVPCEAARRVPVSPLHPGCTQDRLRSPPHALPPISAHVPSWAHSSTRRASRATPSTAGSRRWDTGRVMGGSFVWQTNHGLASIMLRTLEFGLIVHFYIILLATLVSVARGGVVGPSHRVRTHPRETTGASKSLALAGPHATRGPRRRGETGPRRCDAAGGVGPTAAPDDTRVTAGDPDPGEIT
jgi:hypothetical protein